MTTGRFDRHQRRPDGRLPLLRAGQSFRPPARQHTRPGGPCGTFRGAGEAPRDRPSPATHFYDDGLGDFATSRRARASDRANGIGDLIVRFKGTPVRNDPAAMGLGVDARLPTGDEQDMLGLGAWGLRPFSVLSTSQDQVSPHLNVAYLWKSAERPGRRRGHGPEGRPARPGPVRGGGRHRRQIGERLTLAFDFPRDPRHRLAAVCARDVRRSKRPVASADQLRHENRRLVSLASRPKFDPTGRLLVDFDEPVQARQRRLARREVTPLLGIRVRVIALSRWSERRPQQEKLRERHASVQLPTQYMRASQQRWLSTERRVSNARMRYLLIASLLALAASAGPETALELDWKLQAGRLLTPTAAPACAASLHAHQSAARIAPSSTVGDLLHGAARAARRLGRKRLPHPETLTSSLHRLAPRPHSQGLAPGQSVEIKCTAPAC